MSQANQPRKQICFVVLLSGQTSNTKKEITADFCQDNIGQNCKVHASQKSLSDVLGQKVCQIF